MKLEDRKKIVLELMSFAPKRKNKIMQIEIYYSCIEVAFRINDKVWTSYDIYFNNGLEDCLKKCKKIKKRFKEL